jgi:hypothetical protein
MDVLTCRRIRHRALALLCACLVSTILAAGLSSQVGLATRPPGDESLEYRVKAAYLLNFTRYVEWPAKSLDVSDSTLSICVLGADPFGRVLDATVAGRTAHGMPLNVRRIRSSTEAPGCEVVFVSRETWQRSPAILRGLAQVGSLTVGESEQFARRGGVIGFVIIDETVRFVVNDEARGRAGLRISSRMLSLAAAIYGRSGP